MAPRAPLRGTLSDRQLQDFRSLALITAETSSPPKPGSVPRITAETGFCPSPLAVRDRHSCQSCVSKS